MACFTYFILDLYVPNLFDNYVLPVKFDGKDIHLGITLKNLFLIIS